MPPLLPAQGNLWANWEDWSTHTPGAKLSGKIKSFCHKQKNNKLIKGRRPLGGGGGERERERPRERIKMDKVYVLIKTAMRVIEGKRRQLGGVEGGGGGGGGGGLFKEPCSKHARKWLGGRPAADTHS